MVRHIVMFKLQPEALGCTARENALKAKQAFEQLVGVVPGMLSLSVELNSDKADSTNYDLVLVTEHTDFPALDAYQNHPEHKRIGQFIGQIRLERACVDFEI